MFNSWSRTQKSTLRPVAGDSPTSRTANPEMSPSIKRASPATSLRKLTTTFSLNTHRRRKPNTLHDLKQEPTLPFAGVASHKRTNHEPERKGLVHGQNEHHRWSREWCLA